MVDLLRWIKPRLPAGYRAFIGSAPIVAVGGPDEKPDVSVRQWPADLPPQDAPLAAENEEAEPDVEIALATLDPSTSLYVAQGQRLIAAIELISPRNKDRIAAQTASALRYASYLLQGVNLLLIDVHPRPRHFSFADQIAVELQMAQPPLPAPLAVSYRVGGPAATGGSFLAMWRRSLVAGTALPSMPLPLTVELSIPVNLEDTYQRAAADAYLP
jgi:hypothetical protein